jgi:hypothetical protein
VLTRARGVLSCRQGHVIVLMSLHTAGYHTLDEVGSQVWDAIGDGAPLDEVVARVMTACDVSDSGAAGEIRAFIGELIERRLVDVDAPRRTDRPAIGERVIARAPPLPPTSACVLLLALVSMALPTFGLERVWRRAHGRTVRALAPLPDDYAEQLARRVTFASSLCPFRTQCLEQSLLVLWALRRAGADAHLRFGVLPYPFMAHAWVGSRGVPVNDSVEALKLYRPFPLLDMGAI